MKMLSSISIMTIALFATTMSMAQSKKAPGPPTASKPGATQKVPAKKQAALTPQQKFVLDVIQSAVGLPQSDPQDRLRVLASAANVAETIRPALAKQFAREGMRIEQELISAGETPAVSILESGHVDCASVQSFVENIPDSKVGAAEQSLIGAVSMCPKEALQPVQRKVEAALDQGVVAPRALMAVIDRVGLKSSWAQQEFLKMFASLPAKVEDYKAEAPNFAAMYSHMAPEMNKDAAKKAGIQLLLWLGKMDEGGPRNLAVNITTGSMKDALGEKGYEQALESDVMARQVAQTAGQKGEMERPEEESVSVLEAMGKTGEDRSAELSKMPPSLRAREAAASGFASGSDGNRKQADRYFDIAFSALEDVWSNRSERKDAPAVVEEVSEAAAQVDPVDALKRAQRLQDPSEQAISMLAVARVVAGQQAPESANK